MASERVLLAGRRVAVSPATRAALESRGLAICGTVEDADSAVTVAEREHPDVCLLEADLTDALKAANAIWTRVPDTSVVVVGDPATTEDVFVAIAAGAAGFLPSSTRAERLAAAVTGVTQGEAALPRNLVADLIAEFRHRGSRERLDEALAVEGVRLTRREQQILELLADGHSSADIGSELGISATTVRSHIASTMRKLGVATREEAVSVYKTPFRNPNGE